MPKTAKKRGAISARLPGLLSKLLGKLTNQRPVSGSGGLLHALLQPGGQRTSTTARRLVVRADCGRAVPGIAVRFCGRIGLCEPGSVRSAFGEPWMKIIRQMVSTSGRSHRAG